jgi:hypothetical protein
MTFQAQHLEAGVGADPCARDTPVPLQTCQVSLTRSMQAFTHGEIAVTVSRLIAIKQTTQPMLADMESTSQETSMSIPQERDLATHHPKCLLQVRQSLTLLSSISSIELE